MDRQNTRRHCKPLWDHNIACNSLFSPVGLARLWKANNQWSLQRHAVWQKNHGGAPPDAIAQRCGWDGKWIKGRRTANEGQAKSVTGTVGWLCAVVTWNIFLKHQPWDSSPLFLISIGLCLQVMFQSYVGIYYVALPCPRGSEEINKQSKGNTPVHLL